MTQTPPEGLNSEPRERLQLRHHHSDHQVGVMSTVTEDPAARERARAQRDLAIRALRLGRGIRWAADITTLPLRFVDRIAREHGIPDVPSPGADRVRMPGAWETTLAIPVRVRVAALRTPDGHRRFRGPDVLALLGAQAVPAQ
jgi:hypothetical protein